MSEATNDIFIKSVLETMWSLLGKQEFHGLTPYEVARKIGLNHDGAKKVEKLWDGPKIF